MSYTCVGAIGVSYVFFFRRFEKHLMIHSIYRAQSGRGVRDGRRQKISQEPTFREVGYLPSPCAKISTRRYVFSGLSSFSRLKTDAFVKTSEQVRA